MTITEQIIETIYRYYPKNSDCVSDDEYGSRPEVLLRSAKFDIAKNDASAWLAFKADLRENLSLEDFSITVSDYSYFGNGPSYWAAFAIKDIPSPKDRIEVSIVVSTIVDFWSYRFMDKASLPASRYEIFYEEERKKIGLVAVLIKKHFSNYQLLEPDVHQVVLPEIQTPYTNEPTIFQTIFVH